ncbi:hypothetical protein DOTSEDRAFT_174406 [Dothistroma septosporum NZE10]|uniref:FAD-binding domain-containing protein n=1 Tax=Dothistroma septosporum (strain NZE10 / CBS 128990) TaxID=675120 RepID=M2YNF6_DOTSN|nr:hypothetical protein DOTSEDRAFT_174406 [Dothistroma septosporum NZE10]
MPLNIIVVGAGIAGLSAAIGLARHGHKVTVYERRSSMTREDSGSGMQLQANVGTILQDWGLMQEIRKVAHDPEVVDLRTNSEGSIATQDYAQKGEAPFGLRRVLKDVFRDHAIKQGVKIHEGAGIERVDVDEPAIILPNDRRIAADLIIGADGTNSRVRRTLFPDFKPKVLNAAVFQVLLPLDKVKQDPELRAMLDGNHVFVTVSPGRSVVGCPAAHQDLMDMQYIDHEYSLRGDPHPNHHTMRIYDLSWLRERYSDHGLAIRKFLEQADETFKWRLTEVKGVPSWSSSNGKVVLLGDAVHGMVPYTGQGSAMGIEDAAILSHLLRSATASTALPPIMARYEQIRRKRCEIVQYLANLLGRSWSAKEAKKIQQRNEMWRHINDTADLTAKPDANAPWGSAPFLRWLDTYDVVAACGEGEGEGEKARL